MDPNNQNQAPNTPSAQPAPGSDVLPAQSTQPAGPPTQPLTQNSNLPPQPTPVNYQNPTPPNPYAQPQPTQQYPPGQAPPPDFNQPLKGNPNSTQNSLEIAEIRDGIVILNDGSYRSIVMAKSINFDLMSPQEREAVEYAYQGFLNSLYFDIQIFIRSQKVDMRSYVDLLNKKREESENMLLSMLMDDYIYYIEALVSQTNIMDKKFYIVVPFFPPASPQQAVKGSRKLFGSIFGKDKNQKITINEADLEQAKTELRNRTQAVLNGLHQIGIQSIPLDTQELIELYYDVYNPDTASRQQLSDLDGLESPVVTRGSSINTPSGGA